MLNDATTSKVRNISGFFTLGFFLDHRMRLHLKRSVCCLEDMASFAFLFSRCDNVVRVTHFIQKEKLYDDVHYF